MKKASLFIDIYLHLCKKQAFLLTFVKPLLCSPDDSADHVYVNTGDNDSIAGVSSDAESHKRVSPSSGTKSTKHNKETETLQMVTSTCDDVLFAGTWGQKHHER